MRNGGRLAHTRAVTTPVGRPIKPYPAGDHHAHCPLPGQHLVGERPAGGEPLGPTTIRAARDVEPGRRSAIPRSFRPRHRPGRLPHRSGRLPHRRQGVAARRRSVRPAAPARRRPRATVHLPAVRGPELHSPDAPGLQRGELAAHSRHHRQHCGQPVVLRRQYRSGGGRPDAAAPALGAACRAAARTHPLHPDLWPDQRTTHGTGRLRLPDPGAPVAARDPGRHRRRSSSFAATCAARPGPG
jgi:hypothetical protein